MRIGRHSKCGLGGSLRGKAFLTLLTFSESCSKDAVPSSQDVLEREE